MATFSGNDGVIKVGALTLGEVRSFTINETADTIDDTVMGDADRTHRIGKKSFDITAECLWDDGDAAQTSLTAGAVVEAHLYAEGTAGGSNLITTAGFTFTTNFAVDSELLTATAHGLQPNDRITLTTAGTLPTGLALTTRYYVINVVANGFEVSLNGTDPVTFSDDGTSAHSVETDCTAVVTSVGETQSYDNSLITRNFTCQGSGTLRHTTA